MAVIRATTKAEIVAPHIRDLDLLAAQLASWLSGKMPETRAMKITNLSYPKGAGLSHETILFDANWTEDRLSKTKSLVVRIKPIGHTVFPDDLFVEQYELMKVMGEQSDVRIAKPLWIEHDASLLGAPFFVMEQRQGRVAVSFPPYSGQGWLFDASPVERRTAWEEAVRQLALIQRVPVQAAPFLRGKWGADQGFDQEWNKWRNYYAWVKGTADYPFIDKLWRHLEADKPKNRPAGIVWGDARLGNMMFGPNYRVTAVLDWEQPSLGGALQDLGWWLFTDFMQTAAQGLPIMDGMGSRADTIALWSEISGKSTADIEWYEAFTALKMACMSVRMFTLNDALVPGMNVYDNGGTRAVAKFLGWEAPKPPAEFERKM